MSLVAEFARQASELMASGKPRSLWWLSFCDGDRPEGSQFLGVCIVLGLAPEGIDERVAMASAIRASHLQGCNPGGEVSALPLQGAMGVVDGKWLNRLLSREECEAFDAPTGQAAPAGDGPSRQERPARNGRHAERRPGDLQSEDLRQARRAERERCAKMLEDTPELPGDPGNDHLRNVLRRCSAAIRALPDEL